MSDKILVEDLVNAKHAQVVQAYKEASDILQLLSEAIDRAEALDDELRCIFNTQYFVVHKRLFK